MTTIRQNETNIWSSSNSRDSSYIVGQSDTVIGDSTDSGRLLITLLIGEPYKTVIEVETGIDVNIESKADTVTTSI